MTEDLRQWCLKQKVGSWTDEIINEAFDQITARLSAISEKDKMIYLHFLQTALSNSLDMTHPDTILQSLCEVSLADKYIPYLAVIDGNDRSVDEIYMYLICCTVSGKGFPMNNSIQGVEFIRRIPCSALNGRQLVITRAHTDSVSCIRLPRWNGARENTGFKFPVSCDVQVGDWVRSIIIDTPNQLVELSPLGPLPNINPSPLIILTFATDIPLSEDDVVIVEVLGTLMTDDIRDAYRDSLERHPIDYRSAGFHRGCFDNM